MSGRNTNRNHWRRFIFEIVPEVESLGYCLRLKSNLGQDKKFNVLSFSTQFLPHKIVIGCDALPPRSIHASSNQRNSSPNNSNSPGMRLWLKKIIPPEPPFARKVKTRDIPWALKIFAYFIQTQINQTTLMGFIGIVLHVGGISRLYIWR